ncbi:ficolin-2 [Candidatus Magnetomorum sp. HK-1]|nr:ficolin-2 [Candidatus Magnetomorum sp. HK-1]
MKNRILLSLVFVMVTSTIYANNIPQTISFQGKLIDSKTQKPVTAQKKFTFKIGDWIESHNNVQVKNGLYSVILGSIHPIPLSVFENKQVSLEILVDSKSFEQTIALVSVPYAFKAAQVEGIDVEGDNISISGGIKIGSTDVCDPSTEGMQRYNATIKKMEFCNGTEWQLFGCSQLFSSCKDVLEQGCSTGNGIYFIDPDGLGGNEAFNVYCDMTTDGGGWIVIQRRQDGSVDFYQDWDHYKNGFGVLDSEFWLGNDNIHILTHSTDVTLRIDMQHEDGTTKNAQYSSFLVDDESNKYQLTVGGFSGDAGDSLRVHNNMFFSTNDVDNDVSGGNCSKSYKGAWWYRKCHDSNLNGFYYGGKQSSYADGIDWNSWTGHYYSLPFVEMKIR